MQQVPWALIAAVVVALGWLPVFIKFFRSWQARTNPVSLAICILVALAIYLPTYAVLTLPPSWPLATFLTLDSFSCIAFYVAFWWSHRYFKSDRSRAPSN